jgi:hypothetical protein
MLFVRGCEASKTKTSPARGSGKVVVRCETHAGLSETRVVALLSKGKRTTIHEARALGDGSDPQDRFRAETPLGLLHTPSR